MISYLIIVISVGALGFTLAPGYAAPISSEPFEALGSVHVVHLRTGTIDVAAEQTRLPPPTPSARRRLLQEQQQHEHQLDIPATPALSPEWGPLGNAQLWLLTLGPSMHWQEGGEHLHVQQGATTSHILGERRTAHDPRQPHELHRGDSTRPRFGAVQAQLRDTLHAAGCVVVSSLPPAAWLMAVGEEADLAPVLEAYPDVRLAPYGPPGLKVAPELSVVLGLLHLLGEAVAERIAAGERLDDLMEEAKAEQPGWLLGAMRAHIPTRGSRTLELDLDLDLEAANATQPVRVQVEVHFPHLDDADLAVLGAEDQANGGGVDLAGYHPASAAAADWAEVLAALSPPECPPVLEPDFGSPELLLVAVCPVALEAVVGWLAAAPQVTWVAPRMASRVHNLVAGAIVQTGGNVSLGSTQANTSHPFWLAGIDGRNQVVGCGDSGLDYSNCFFYDSNAPVSFKSDSSMQYFLSDAHRKLRYYLAMVQDTSDSFGHGTHVSGTLVGARCTAYNTSSGLNTMDGQLSKGTGQAPAAKIAFLDLSRGNSDGVWTPGDLYRSYFILTYKYGARIHSDSWGSELTAYDSMSASLDRFTYYNQDFVSVFAAGNYGDRSDSSGKGTVTSPAVAKNVIAVGATLSLTSPNRMDWVPMANMTTTLDVAGEEPFVRSVRVVKAGFGADLVTSLPAGGAQLVVADPENACAGLSNAGLVSGKVVLVIRGGCYFTDKARYAAQAGAKAVIVYNDVKDSGYFSMSPPSDTSVPISVAVGSVPLSTGLWLKASVAAGSVTVVFSPAAQPASYGQHEDIASYSSVGPTTDGRIKPDIVAPGTLMSANSSKNWLLTDSIRCNDNVALTTMMGTSMATPVVAGSALLVRQYFTDGYYPDGVRDPSKAIQPSGPLIKAVMLGGAAHMTGVVADTGMPLEDAPSYRQGYGRLSLLHALPLPQSISPSSPGWKLQVVDGATLSQGSEHQFCVRAGGGPLRITLAWYDYPSELAAARTLVNNLDLQVRAVGRGGVLDYGNGVQDNVNTVEQVWYDKLPSGDVSISVVATSLSVKTPTQAYALVVQGVFTGTLRAPTVNTDSSNTCAAQQAIIDDYPISSPSITRNKDLTFGYRTQDGSNPKGFECRLLRDGANDSVPFTPCPLSGITYPNQEPDGTYVFQVRVVNEQIAASRTVQLDSTKPVVSLTTTLDATALNSGTASDNCTFTFTANDSTAVVSQCRLDFAGGPADTPIPSYLQYGPSTARVVSSSNFTVEAGAPVLIRTWFPCTSPLELVGMSYGDYTLQLRVSDSAGNQADDRQVNWKIRYSSDSLYARVTTGPRGLVNTSDLIYQAIGFFGSTAVSTPVQNMALQGGPATYQHTLAEVPPTSAIAAANWTLRSLAATPIWTQLVSDKVQTNASEDGNYVFVVRPNGLVDVSTWGVAYVQVDTTPPVVDINPPVNSYQFDTVVVIKFGDKSMQDDARAFFCRWLGPSASPPDPATPDSAAPYSTCSGSSRRNVSEGYWLFQVKGQDAAGNIGVPANAPFYTDLMPPDITTNLTLAPFVNVSRLSWSYSVVETGSGLANVSCRFRLVNPNNGNDTVNGDTQYPPALQTDDWKTPCPGPPIRYSLQEGSYSWSISATDRAGLKSYLDVQVVADFTPPYSRMTQAPRRALPSRFAMNVSSKDLPVNVASGVAKQWCLIDVATAPPPSSPPPSPPLPPPPSSPPPAPIRTGSGTSSFQSTRTVVVVGSSGDDSGSGGVAATAPAGGGGGGTRRRLAQQAAGSGAPALANGTLIQFGVWHLCDLTGAATSIVYDNFTTGYYIFSLRAQDNAGNLGNPITPIFFSVDASLPSDGSQTVVVDTGDGGDGSGDKTKWIVIGVAAGVGAILLVLSAAAIVYARKRHLRKRYAASAITPSTGHGIAMQAMQQSTNGNGHANGNGYNGHSNGGYPPPPPPPSVINGRAVSMHSNGGAPALPPPGAYYIAPVQPPQDPALAAALAASAAEAERARRATAEEAERARRAAAAADEERLRRAIAASIEEENLRRAKEASLTLATQQTMEKAAVDAAIAASIASADQERQRQNQLLQQQMQQQQEEQQRAWVQQQQQQQQQQRQYYQQQQYPPSAPPQPPQLPQPPPPQRPSGPPDYGLI